MTLVEVMVAILVLTVAVYMLSSTITASIGHASTKRERALAVEATMNLLERMRSEPFDELFARYNADPKDDPEGHGTAPGPYFDVLGLDPQADGPWEEPHVGRVFLPEGQKGKEKGGLYEDLVMPDLSMPRDLNGDLLTDSLDHSSDYIVLPVTVRVAWSGRAGEREFRMSTMFAKLEKIE